MRASWVRIIVAAIAAGFLFGLLVGKAAAYRSSVASWDGPGLYGNHMGCGGILTTRTWGVAHKSLPCGTRIRICMRRCVYARVVDRGPYVAGRDLDLTKPVADAIGLTPYGRAVVVWSVRR
jgi:rare lipoprotein A